MADFDYGALAQYFQPSPEDQKRALQASLMATGFGILANNTGHYGALGPALGAGGLTGMDMYSRTMLEGNKLRGDAITQGLAAERMKRDMQAQDAFAKMYGGGPQAASVPPPPNQPPPMPGSALPTAAPTAGAAKGPSLDDIGRLMGLDPVRGKAALELWQAQNPGMQVSNGYAFNPRTQAPGFLPSMNVTTSGQAVQTNIGPDGQPSVSIPKGAPEAFQTFEDTKNRSSARFGPAREVPLPSGQTQRMTPEQESDFLRGQAQPGAPAAAPIAPAGPPSVANPTPFGSQPLVVKDEPTANKWRTMFKDMGIQMDVQVRDDQWQPGNRADSRARANATLNTASNTALPAVNTAIPARNTGGNTALPASNTGMPGITVGQTDQQKADQAAKAAGQREEATTVAKAYGEQYAKVQQAGFNAPSKIARLTRMEQLLGGIDTGKLTPLTSSFMQTANSLGIKIDPKWNNVEAAEAIGNEMALELRNPAGGAGMPGSMSDSDRVFLKNMVAGANQTPETRKLMVYGSRKLAERDQEVATLARDYRKKNGQIDEGFFDTLQKFSDANPMFTEKDKGGSNTLSADEQSELAKLRARFKR